MTVSVTFSSTQGGSSITSVNYGTGSNGQTLTAQDVFIRHNGTNAITACGLYISPQTGTYTGSANATADFNELTQDWGANNTADGFGGIQVNMNATGGFTSTWASLSHSSKDVLDGSSNILAFTCRDESVTDRAISSSTSVTLNTAMSSSMTVAGTIPAGVTDARFQTRAVIPTDENTAGIRQWRQVLKFTYTS